MGLQVQHRAVAPPPPRVLLGQRHGRAPQVPHAGQPLQRQRVVGLPTEGGRVVEELDAGRVRENVVVHGGLLVEERPGLVGQAGQRRLVGPEVGAVEDEGLGAAVPRRPPAAGGQAGAPRAVDPLRVAGEVREQAPAPPQQDGQRLVAPRVVVAGAAVRRGGHEGRARRDGILRPPARRARLLSARRPGLLLLLQRRPVRGQRGPAQRQHHAEGSAAPPRAAARPAAPHARRPGPAPPAPPRPAPPSGRQDPPSGRAPSRAARPAAARGRRGSGAGGGNARGVNRGACGAPAPGVPRELQSSSGLLELPLGWGTARSFTFIP